MAEYKIHWPGEVDDSLVTFLRDLHRIPWAEVVSYQNMFNESDDKGIREYLKQHCNQNEFVYVYSRTQVGVLIEDKRQGGWFETFDEGFFRTLWHNAPREGSLTDLRMQCVYCYEGADTQPEWARGVDTSRLM